MCSQNFIRLNYIIFLYASAYISLVVIIGFLHKNFDAQILLSFHASEICSFVLFSSAIEIRIRNSEISLLFFQKNSFLSIIDLLRTLIFVATHCIIKRGLFLTLLHVLEAQKSSYLRIVLLYSLLSLTFFIFSTFAYK